jgi:hypothetical protein
MSKEAPANWYSDPTGRHQYRYWDGARWTDTVADNGSQSIDLLVPAAAPLTRREMRQQAKADARAQKEAEREAKRLQEVHERQVRELAAKQAEAARVLAEQQKRAEQEAAARAALERQEARLRAEQEARAAAEREAREAQDREARIITQYPRFRLPDSSGYPTTEVAGEFARIDAIHRVLGRAPRIDQELVNENLVALLVPEPQNAFDRNAVKVVISGYHVGYLEKEVAAITQPIIRRIIDAGYAPAVGARIWAVARRGYDAPAKQHANVRLALTYTHLMTPRNDPPHEAYSILPWASALQVTGEEHHQHVLAEYATEGDSLVIGTLHVVHGGTAKAPKELIEVRLDGERIGQMTPASSQHFLPTVHHLAAQGMTAAAWVTITGSAIAAQAVLHATKAHELPTEWFEAPQTAPRLWGTPARRAVDDGAIDDAEIRAQMREPMWDEP